ncbi:MAG TPA: hypothetical protein DHU79_03590 [Clostridiales bacterium]|nr:hypothetical protein [Clostridiales bacterium]
MKQRKFLVVLLALVMMLCVCAVVACTVEEQAKATGITLDVGKLGTLQEGATLDVSKLKITVSYSDKTQKDIAAGDVTLTLDGKAYNKEPLTEGEHTVKVSYVPAENADPLTAEAKITVSHVHNYGEVHKGTPATCTTAGTKDYYECACGKKFVKDGDNYVETTDLTIAIDSNAHDFAGQPYIDGGAEGHYQQCKLNGEHHSATEAHTGGTATCQKLAKCGKCNAEYGTLADHVYGNIVPAKDATIDEAGNVEYKDCNVCKKHFDNDGKEIADVTIPKLEAVTIKFVGIDRADIRIAKGTTTTIEEPAKKGYVFKGWKVNGAEGALPETYESDTTLEAIFEEGYDFKKNSDGAAATTTTDGAEQGSLDMTNAADSNGLRYWLPTKDAVYELVFPKIDYTMYKAVNFTWRTRSYVILNTHGYNDNCWTQGDDIAGNVEVIVNGTKLIVVVTGPNNYRHSTVVEDADVINGTKGLNVMNALNWAANTWFDIAVKSVHHEYTTRVNWTDKNKLKMSDNCKNARVEDGTFIVECQDKTGDTLNSQNYTITMPKFDFTSVSKVTTSVYYNNINGEGGTLSIGGTTISPSSATNDTFELEFRNENGTVKIYVGDNSVYTLTEAQANGTEAISVLAHVAHVWNQYVSLKISALTIVL